MGEYFINDFDWGDITNLAKSIMSNEDERDFTLNDYGIYDIHDLPCPFGIQEYILNLTKSSTSTIESLIENLIFLPFEYCQN